MLHVTNGDSAVFALQEAGVEGELLPWRDVLHEGPVPATERLEELARVRARFLSASGWASYDRALADLTRRDRTYAAGLAGGGPVVLWFEHDLYDQLQLLDVLRRAVGAEGGVAVVQLDSHLTSCSPPELRRAFAARQPLSAATVAYAVAAWQAFTSSDPGLWVELAARPSEGQLPHMAAAWRRLLEELPGVGDGLSRCERQLLEELAPGGVTLAQAFERCQHREAAAFLGDAVFAEHALRLAGEPHPLLAAAGGSPLTAPPPGDWRSLWRQTPSLTAAGRQVLSGTADAVALRGVDRWLGGTRLAGRAVAWRWNPARGLAERSG